MLAATFTNNFSYLDSIDATRIKCIYTVKFNQWCSFTVLSAIRTQTGFMDMNKAALKDLIETKTGAFLRSARESAGLARETACAKLGYVGTERLDQYERGSSVPCREFARIIKRYGTPIMLLENFLVELQHEVSLIKTEKASPKVKQIDSDFQEDRNKESHDPLPGSGSGLGLVDRQACKMTP